MIKQAIRPNLVITGFMGTGKTAVGDLVARRLGRELVDTDRLIEVRLGLTIPEIFTKHGEAFFRKLESELIEELAASSGKIVATGGGTLVPDANRERIAESSIVVNLRCRPEEILKRLEKEHHRPLLAGGDRLEAIRRLMDARRPQYDKVTWQVDTTSLSIDQVAGEIIAGYLRADVDAADAPDAQRIEVDWPTGVHQVIFGRQLLGQVGKILRENRMGGPVALVTNPLVGGFHGGVVREGLQAAGFDVRYIEVPDGEEHKNLNTVSYLYDRFIEAGVDRSSTVIALGGGVTSDTVGYAASTFMRGVPLVNVPTTLLAQVDASTGGKVGVDHPRGKNLIGAFFAPRLVVVDPLALRSLPTAEVRAGSAEIVKSAMIRSAELFERIERSGSEPTDDIIWDCLRIKAEVVSRDPFEKGERAILNFGHTIGHGIEAASQYRVGHGEAVSVGMVAATKIATEMELCAPSVGLRLGKILSDLSLPSAVEGISPEAVWQAMAVDKKKRAGKLRYVLPTAVGSVTVTSEVPEEAVQRALCEVVVRAR